ncbi:MAG: hypothetical protein ABIJ16_09700 [Bacteroidota bacterium]
MKRPVKIAIEFLVWAIIVAYLVVVLGFVADREKEVQCSKIEVEVTDMTGNKFIGQTDIVALFKKHNEKILGYSNDTINTARLEELVRAHPSVQSAEIFNTVTGVLKVKIKQRNPLIRVINYNNESYYIDENGALMPLSSNYTAHVLVASGNINEPYALRYTTNVADLSGKDEPGRESLLSDLFTLASFISSDPFWKAQVEQIYVNQDNEFELIPKVGDHVVLFGNAGDYERKFRNLYLLYTVGLPSEGWKKYEKINLKYKNQVVCTKKQNYEPEN